MEERVAVGVLDTMFLGVAGAHPWTVHAEVDLPATVRPRSLADAARQVADAHPMLRARLSSTTTDWLIDARPPPLVEHFDEGDRPLAELRDALLSDAADMPGQRTVRFCAYEHGPGRTTLLLVAHHAALDGVGARIALEGWVAALQGRPVAPDDTWRRARRLDSPPVTAEVASAASDRLMAMVHSQPQRLGRPVAEPQDGPVYGVLSADTPAVTLPPRSSITLSDIAIASVANAVRAEQRAVETAVHPLFIGVPVNLRPPRAWAAGVVNASLPWTIRVDDDTLPSVVRSVAAQRQAARAGLLAPGIRALLGEIRGRRQVPLRLKVGLARLSTMVSTMGDTTITWAGEPLHPWGTPPAAPWTGATFAVVEEPSSIRLSVRYVRSTLSHADARRILARAASNVGLSVDEL